MDELGPTLPRPLGYRMKTSNSVVGGEPSRTREDRNMCKGGAEPNGLSS